MSIRVRVTSPALSRAADLAMQKVALAVFDRLQAEFLRVMGARIWSWGGTTQRTKGTAGSPRNIIDTGLLRASWDRKITGNYQATWTWVAGYAAAIHEGAVLNNGGIIEPRPWTDVVTGRKKLPGYTPPDLGQTVAQSFERFFRL